MGHGRATISRKILRLSHSIDVAVKRVLKEDLETTFS